MVFFLAICCGKQVLFQYRNTKKSYIFIGSVYLYIWLILEYRVIYLLLLCRYSLNFTNLYGKCYSFKFSVVIMECVVVLIGVSASIDLG